MVIFTSFFKKDYYLGWLLVILLHFEPQELKQKGTHL